MPKRVIWKQMTVKQDELAKLLTVHNLQARQFAIAYIDNGLVLVVYIDKEIPNVEQTF